MKTDRNLVEIVEMIEIAIIPTILNAKLLKLIYAINMHTTVYQFLRSVSIIMHEYHYIRYHFVRRSDCTYISFDGPLHLVESSNVDYCPPHFFHVLDILVDGDVSFSDLLHQV